MPSAFSRTNALDIRRWCADTMQEWKKFVLREAAEERDEMIRARTVPGEFID